MLSKTKADIKAFLTSSGAITVLDAVRNVVTANLLGPYMAGVCMTLMVIPQVTQYMNIGIIDALQVLVPRYRGSGKTPERLKNTVLSVSILIASSALIAVLLYVLAFSPYSRSTNILIVMAGLLSFFFPAKKYFVTLYAANDRFRKLSLIEFSFSSIVTVSQITFLYFFGAVGFWMGFLFTNLVVTAWLAKNYMKENTLRPFSIDLKELKTAVPLGMSMLICGVSYMPFLLLARLFLAKAGGVKEVGYFVLAMVILAKLSIVPSAIAKVIMPKISRMHAESGSLDESYKLYLKAQLLTFAMTLFIFAVGLLSMEKVVSVIMPQYVHGVPGAKMMLLAGIPFCLIDNANNFILALEQKRIYLFTLATAIAAQILIFITLYYYGTASAAAISTSLIYVFLFYAILVNAQVFRLHRRSCSTRRVASDIGVMGTGLKIS
ncbi:MAG: hypothetical protein HYY44_09350 [Deltaproteobacteria bacterium]|nr:hypothetical protein [Deltaproteobacteria bacterium]